MTLPFDPTQYIGISPLDLVESSILDSPLHQLVAAVSYLTEHVPNTDVTRQSTKIYSVHAFQFKAKLDGCELVLVLSHNNKLHWKFNINLKVVERTRYRESEKAARQVIHEAFDQLFVAFYIAEQNRQIASLQANIGKVKAKVPQDVIQDAVMSSIIEWVNV